MTTDPFPSALSLLTPSKTSLVLSHPSITCNIQPPAIKLGPHDATLKITKDRVLILHRTSFIRQVLIGRRTCVVRATVVEGDSDDSEWENEAIVIKSSFVPNTKVSERDSDIFQDSIMATNSNGVELCPCGHNEAFPMDTTDAQCRLSNYTPSRDTKYENRVLRLFIMTELFQMIDMTADTLIAVIKDVFKCYKWLHEKIGVIHRDINENNMMYWKKADGTISGVLIDYDFPLMLARQDRRPSAKQRTGSRAFTARDLLRDPTPIQHLYRHDLESLFYVIVVLMFRSQDKELKEDESFKSFPDLQRWFTLGAAELLKEKKAFFSTELPPTPPAFEKLYLPISEIIQMFYDGYGARGRHALMLKKKPAKEPLFDETTLGGHVDFDKFEKILDSI